MRHLVLVVTLAFAATAHADAPKKPLDAATRANASAHVKQADEFLKTNQWDKAIAEYQAAFDLTDEPLMIFNIALANDRAGRPEQALAGFRRYLAIAPQGPVADEAREDVARLVPVVDRIERDRAAAKAKQDAEARRLAEQRAEEERTRAARAEQQRTAERAQTRAATLRWAAIGAGAAGVVVIGVGAKFGLDAAAASDDVSAHVGGWTDVELARDREGRSAETKQIVLTSVGGALVAGGGVLWFLSRRAHQRAERLRVGIAPASGGAFASVTARF